MHFHFPLCVKLKIVAMTYIMVISNTIELLFQYIYCSSLSVSLVFHTSLFCFSAWCLCCFLFIQLTFVMLSTNKSGKKLFPNHIVLSWTIEGMVTNLRPTRFKGPYCWVQYHQCLSHSLFNWPLEFSHALS